MHHGLISLLSGILLPLGLLIIGFAIIKNRDSRDHRNIRMFRIFFAANGILFGDAVRLFSDRYTHKTKT